MFAISLIIAFRTLSNDFSDNSLYELYEMIFLTIASIVNGMSEGFMIIVERTALRKKCPYSELFWPAFSPRFPHAD